MLTLYQLARRGLNRPIAAARSELLWEPLLADRCNSVLGEGALDLTRPELEAAREIVTILDRHTLAVKLA